MQKIIFDKMSGVIQLAELVKQFCEIVPYDYMQARDERCLLSVIRNYLIQGIDKWSLLELKHVNPLLKNTSLTNRLTAIGNYAYMEKLSDIFIKFISAEEGKEFKALLEMLN